MKPALKFLVPHAAQAKLAAEMARGAATLESASFAARYLDTDDRRLAKAGIAWRLRREGRRWIQTLKAGGPRASQRFEHEVIRPGASHGASVHAGTPEATDWSIYSAAPMLTGWRSACAFRLRSGAPRARFAPAERSSSWRSMRADPRPTQQVGARQCQGRRSLRRHAG